MFLLHLTEEYVPGAARKGMEWQYFVGNCSDPAVQEQAKRNFQTGMNYVIGRNDPNWCQSENLCALENIRVTCGRTQTKRRRRSVAQVREDFHPTICAKSLKHCTCGPPGSPGWVKGPDRYFAASNLRVKLNVNFESIYSNSRQFLTTIFSGWFSQIVYTEGV